jgi:hypothetical protein
MARPDILEMRLFDLVAVVLAGSCTIGLIVLLSWVLE